MKHHFISALLVLQSQGQTYVREKEYIRVSVINFYFFLPPFIVFLFTFSFFFVLQRHGDLHLISRYFLCMTFPSFFPVLSETLVVVRFSLRKAFVQKHHQNNYSLKCTPGGSCLLSLFRLVLQPVLSLQPVFLSPRF